MTTRVLSIDLGIINFSFCITDFRQHDFEVVHLEKVAIGSMKQTAFQLTTALIDFLRSCQAINEAPIHNIYIEQQMNRAIKNTVLAYATASYFYTEAKIARSDVNIQFVPPRMKFNAIEAYFPGAIESQDICRSKSKELKRLSVKIARSVFTELDISKGVEAMAKYSPKLDDIADAFLQSFAIFLEKKSRRHLLEDNSKVNINTAIKTQSK
ncbi:unnamed protein product [Ectocarpus sp. 6 AP-2014]